MTTDIVIRDLQENDLTTELEYKELSQINGGIAPFVVVAGAGLAGVGVGYGLATLLDND